MIKFRILDTQVKRIEFKYLYVWEDKYECVDARYVNITTSRDVALYNFKIYIYKLMYLNPSMTEDDFVFHGLNIVLEALKNKGVYILDSDVYSICSELFHNDFDSELYSLIKTKKKIEWKSDLRELLKNIDENSSDVKKEIRNIKIKESIRCLNTLKMDRTKKIILDAIVGIKEENGVCCISDISKKTGISYNTVKRHYEDYMNDILLDEYHFIINKNSSLKDEKLSLMKEAIDKLKGLGIKVNKLTVSEYSGVSRSTVYKRWEELTKYIL